MADPAVGEVAGFDQIDDGEQHQRLMRAMPRGPIYAAESRRKVAVFKGVTATGRNVLLTFLTTHGIAPNAYAKELVPLELTTDCLFGEVS